MSKFDKILKNASIFMKLAVDNNDFIKNLKNVIDYCDILKDLASQSNRRDLKNLMIEIYDYIINAIDKAGIALLNKEEKINFDWIFKIIEEKRGELTDTVERINYFTADENVKSLYKKYMDQFGIINNKLKTISTNYNSFLTPSLQELSPTLSPTPSPTSSPTPSQRKTNISFK